MSIFFEWSENISVGNDTIDSQHKKLLTQINKIIKAITFNAEVLEIKEILTFFDDYINEHFSYEEKYMKSINYPYIEEHKEKHKDFIKNYIKFKDEFNKNINKDKIILDIENYIGKWWIDHIGKEDKKYQLFLENKK